MVDQSQDWELHMSPSRWSHRLGPQEVLDAHTEFMEKETKQARWALDCELDISYGETEKQKLDVYVAKGGNRKGCPMVVYIHGGYWQALGRELSGFFAPSLVPEGITVVAVGYELAPDASMDEIVSQIKKALHFIFKLAKERQSSGIYLVGHSAGAHLAAVMLAADFCEEDAFDAELIKGAVLVSGIYDLRPLVKTTVNHPLHLTVEDAWRFSPANFISDIVRMSKNREIIFAVGEFDPPEFRKQAGDMEKELTRSHIKTRYYDVHDTDHFSVIEKLALPNYMLTKAIKNLVKAK